MPNVKDKVRIAIYQALWKVASHLSRRKIRQKCAISEREEMLSLRQRLSCLCDVHWDIIIFISGRTKTLFFYFTFGAIMHRDNGARTKIEKRQPHSNSHHPLEHQGSTYQSMSQTKTQMCFLIYKQTLKCM